MTSSLRIAPWVVVLVVSGCGASHTTTRAQAASPSSRQPSAQVVSSAPDRSGEPAPERSELERNLERGIFPVVVSDETALLILGEVPRSYASGEVSILSTDPWVFVAEPLGPAAPPITRSLIGARARLVEEGRHCDVTLGEAYVVSIGLRGEIEFGYEHGAVPALETMETGALAAIVRDRAPGSYLAMTASRECSDARVATTQLGGAPRAFARLEASEPSERVYIDAYRRLSSFAALEREAAEEERETRFIVHRRRLDDAVEIAEVWFVIRGDGCGFDPVYAAIFALENGTVRTVDADSPSDVDRWIDVDGDGRIELVQDAGEWTRTIHRLDVQRSTIERLLEVRARTSIGC